MRASPMPATETSPIAPIVSACRASRSGRLRSTLHTRLLSRGGQEVALPPRVLGVLELLLQRAGDVVTRQELIDAVWKDAFVTDTSLAEAVSVLRQALADDPQSPTYIQTLHRRGYRFVAPVSTVGAGTRRGPSSPIGHRSPRPPSRRRLEDSWFRGARRSSARSSPSPRSGI